MTEPEMSELQRLAEIPDFAIGGSHRPLVGPVVTVAKRLALRGLRPLHRSVRTAQSAFNRGLLQHLSGARLPKLLPQELEALRRLADATRPESATPGALGAGPLAPYVRAAVWLGQPALDHQHRWNSAVVDVLEAFARDDTAGVQASVERLGKLSRPNDGRNGVLDRLGNPLWKDALQAQRVLDDHVATLVAQRSAAGEVFRYWDYQIPVELVRLTGGGPETWDSISRHHMDQYARYCPVQPGHSFLEVGCGVGRDAIQLTKVLGPEGKYLGVDIIRPSIEWCRDNITPRFPQFRFECFDIESQIHNAGGKITTRDVRFDLPDGSVDRIALHSVFTHMFREDIVHYLREFRRVLKPDGLALTSWFVVDDDVLALAHKTNAAFRFDHVREPGCRVNDPVYPEGAVGYTTQTIDEMLHAGGMRLAQPPHPGVWSGRKGENGQDVLILGRA